MKEGVRDYMELLLADLVQGELSPVPIANGR